MYLLTRIENNPESGAFASMDDDGTPIVQFFVSKDDAICYNTQLEALGQDLHVTETDPDMFEKMVSILGHAYTVVDEGELVIPKLETLQHVMMEQSPFDDFFQ